MAASAKHGENERAFGKRADRAESGLADSRSVWWKGDSKRDRAAL
ncbi:hypothetical protein [Leptospira tipperaryensis]|nr:hypothetical protein [Leptospira tipperaryensis]